MTNQPLSVRNVTVQTATIRVQTLTLSAKQVTLSVFRQLYEASILDDWQKPTRLLGTGWGWVNYCPGKDRCFYLRGGIHIPHSHLVWQLGEELRQCPLPTDLGDSIYDLDFITQPLTGLPHLFIAI